MVRWVGRCSEGIPLEVPREVHVRPRETFNITLKTHPLKKADNMTIWLVIRTWDGRAIKEIIFSYNEQSINSAGWWRKGRYLANMTKTLKFVAPNKPGKYPIHINAQASAQVPSGDWCYAYGSWSIMVYVGITKPKESITPKPITPKKTTHRPIITKKTTPKEQEPVKPKILRRVWLWKIKK